MRAELILGVVRLSTVNPYVYLFAGPLVMFTSWILRALLNGEFKVGLPTSVRPAAELAVHILSGSLLFALMFCVAAGLNFMIVYFADHGISPKWLVEPAHILETAIWACDALGFLLFMVVQMVLFARQMIAALKAPAAH